MEKKKGLKRCSSSKDKREIYMEDKIKYLLFLKGMRWTVNFCFIFCVNIFFKWIPLRIGKDILLVPYKDFLQHLLLAILLLHLQFFKKTWSSLKMSLFDFFFCDKVLSLMESRRYSRYKKEMLAPLHKKILS